MPRIGVNPVAYSVNEPFRFNSRTLADPGTDGNGVRFPTKNRPFPAAIAVGTMWPCVAEMSTTRSTRPVSGCTCLLYTSDAADERSSVDLGGRRIIKKKKKR